MKSAIDIGTNTVLLLVAENEPNHELRVLYEDQRVPRLGRGVDESQNLAQESIHRVIEALNEYMQILSEQFPGADEPVVTATSAVRDASNRNEFVSQVLEETGLKVRVLSGEEEAEFTFRGALGALGSVSGSVAVLDIGGGSTEVSAGEAGQLYDRHSFDMGCVRFTERYLKGDPPSEIQVRHCRNSIQEILKSRQLKISDKTKLIGVAGTVTSLAYMERGRSESYSADRLNNTVLLLSQIQVWIDKITAKPVSWLTEHYPEVMEGRADIFLAGLLILEEFMKHYGMNELLVSTGGIRYGALV